MRINDILTETRSDEGIVSDIGTGVGKAAGATARGIGAVAGGVRGVWDAAKQGFQAGRNLVGGGGANNANIQKAQTLRAQADQLDGGSSAQQNYAAPAASGRRSGSGGQSRPYTGGGQSATTASNTAAAPAGPDAALQKLQQALQHVKGSDVERIRTMLKKRAGIAEGILSKAASGLGKMNRGYVNAKSAYQQGRGGDMTPQEIDLAIASMPKDQASDLLDFFDTLYPAAAGSSTPVGAAPTTPGSTPPAASTTPTPPGGAAGAGAAGNGAAAAKPFQSAGTATPNNVSFNLPKPAAAKPAAKLQTPPPQARQTVPKPPAARSINGLNLRAPTTEGQIHSSFLGMDL